MKIYTHIKISILSLITATMLSGCVTTNMEIYQQGDQLLSCNQLSTKTADLIDIKYVLNKKTRLNINERFNYLLNLKKKFNCNISHREIAFTQRKDK